MHALHLERAPARLCGLAILRHVNEGLELELVVEQALLRSCGADQVERLANALLALVHTALLDFVRRIVGEEVGHLIPLVLVKVVAVDRLQVLDCIVRFETRDLELPRRE